MGFAPHLTLQSKLTPIAQFCGLSDTSKAGFYSKAEALQDLSASCQLALAPNIATVLVCRFIQGFSGSAPLANTGGVVHDLFARDESGYAVALYALSSTDGPVRQTYLYCHL